MLDSLLILDWSLMLDSLISFFFKENSDRIIFELSCYYSSNLSSRVKVQINLEYLIDARFMVSNPILLMFDSVFMMVNFVFMIYLRKIYHFH